MIDISVVIPAYNCGHTLGRTLQSVLSQTHLPKEIIVVDNGSTDNTAGVIKAFQVQHPALIKCVFEPAKGAAIARNTGLAKASGEWIQFLDADDEIVNDKLAHQLKLIEIHQPDVIIAPYKVIVTNVNQTIHTFEQKISEPVLYALLRSEAGITSSNLYRRKALQKVGGWNESLTSMDDYALTLSLIKSGSTLIIDDRVTTLVHRNYNYPSIERVSGFETIKKNVDNYIGFIKNVSATAESMGQADHKFRREVNLQLFRIYYYYKIINYHKDPVYFDTLQMVHKIRPDFLTKLRVIHSQVSIYHLTASGWRRFLQIAWYGLRYLPKLFIN